MNGIGQRALLFIILAISILPASAQEPTKAESILAGGGSSQSWVASTRGGSGRYAWSRITFFSDMTFLAEAGQKQTMGRWSAPGDGRRALLYDFASGNWKSPDTVVYELGSLAASGFSATRVDPEGNRRRIRFRAEGSGQSATRPKAGRR